MARRILYSMLVTVALLVGLLVLFNHSNKPSVRALVRCLRFADTPVGCLQDKAVSFEVEFEGSRYRGDSGTLIDRFILFTGEFEAPVLASIRDILAVLGPGATCLDVGANTGQHTLLLAARCQAVHAFEPYPPILERLRWHVETNGLSQVVVHGYGLGTEAAELPFFAPPEDNPATGTFVAGFSTENTPTGKLVIRRGDDALGEAGVQQVDFIKSDTEGYEKQVLGGLHDTLWRERPVLVAEISIIPGQEASFTSSADLVAHLPPDYLLYGMEHADYAAPDYQLKLIQLTALDEAIAKGAFQFELVALPKELAEKIPLSGPRS